VLPQPTDRAIAVQTLSVRVPVQAALDLLEGDLGVRLSKLLSSVRFDIDMVEAEAAELADGHGSCSSLIGRTSRLVRLLRWR
jgi:hypothetical protein